MRTIKTIGIVNVAVLALSGIVASTAAAEWKHFTASAAGLTLRGKATSTQVFKSGSGSTDECAEDTPSGTTAGTLVTEQKINIEYKKCKVSGLGGEASVSTAHYTFFTPLAMSLLEVAIILKATAIGVECESEIKAPQSLGAGLAKSGKMEVEYANSSPAGKLLVKLEVEKIESKVLKSNSVTFCGEVGHISTTGTLTASLEIEAVGGTIGVTES